VQRVITVLGMHRSGTSAVAGVMQDYGITFGWMRKPGDEHQSTGRPWSHLKPERNAFNPRGNRENRQLRWLHESILERAGGSWWRPPDSVAVEDGDRRERDEVLATFEGDPVAVKDPRMVLVMDLWRDLDPLPIGVVRNPVVVRESLERRATRPRPEQQRARQHEQPKLPPEGWEALWCHYNRALLAELERAPFPVIDFDRAETLDEQVHAALLRHGVEPSGSSSFYDPELATEVDEDWRDRALLPESVELWDRLGTLASP
jgi:hypothetical protein